MNEYARKYLNQQSSGKLEGFLFYCMNKKCWSSYDYMIPEVFDILSNRGYQVSEALKKSWELYSASVLENPEN